MSTAVPTDRSTNRPTNRPTDRPVGKVDKHYLLHDGEDERANPGDPNVTVEKVVRDENRTHDQQAPDERLEPPEAVVECRRSARAQHHEQEEHL